MEEKVLEILESMRSEIFFCMVGGDGSMDDVMVLVGQAKKQIEELYKNENS